MSQMPEDGSSPYGDLPYALAGIRRKSSPYDRQRQLAYSMMQGGMDTSPIAHPMQGVSRLAQALVGSLMAGRADAQEAEATKARQEAFGKIAGIADPQERIAALGKLDPVEGAKYAGQIAVQELAAKRKAEENQQAANVFGQGFGFGGGQGGGQQQAAMPPEQAKATAQQYVQYLVQNHGFKPEEAAAMVGNLYQESGFNPTALHDNGTGFGMGGWRLDRRDALLRFAQQQQRDPRDPQTQLDFYATELKSRPEFAQFQQAQDPASRQAALMTYFRPAGWTPQAPQNGDGFNNRVQFAQTFAGQAAPPPRAEMPVPQPPGAAPRPTEVPKPEPDPQLVQQAYALLRTGRITPVQAQQMVMDDVNRRWQIAVSETSADRRQAASDAAAAAREQARIEAENRREANKPPTAEQSVSGGFADRMTVSNRLLQQGLENQGTNFNGRLLEGKVMGVGLPFANYAMPEDYRKYKQARDDFINAQLRRESGAAISDPEYERANQQYFPQPGDSAAVVAQKARNRALAVEGMIRNAGPNYKPSPLVAENAAPPAPQQGGGIIPPADAVDAELRRRGLLK